MLTFSKEFTSSKYLSSKFADTVSNIAMASTSKYGLVKPDGRTVLINNGVITAVGEGATYTFAQLMNKAGLTNIDDLKSELSEKDTENQLIV